jgi:16S rRNA (adenine1518-N6/adenine1519-N6)-dimethyltransferase
VKRGNLMSILKETKFIMNKYHITANKNLGQNFLIDDETVAGIVETASVSKEDLIIEIGPGLGTLTKELLERAGKVICIELDKRMIEILEDRFSMYDNFKVINEDVLKVNLKDLIQKEKIKNTKIVANLPYYITTPIIMKLLEDKLDIETITVMIQKEVADRLVTEPGTGDTGAITYAIHYYTNPKRILEVPNTSFIPSPKVNSTVVKLNILKTPSIEVKNEKQLFDIIKTAFMQKRKTLVNAIANSGKYGSKEQVEKTLQKLEIDLKIRPEKMSLEQFAKLSNLIETKIV